MDQALIQRYQPGGDLYAQYAAMYGTAGANQIAAAAQTGDRTQITAVLSQLMFGAPFNTSTTSLLVNQLTTNPLQAPVSSLNSVLARTVQDFLKNPWVLFLVLLGGLLLVLMLWKTFLK
jgi:hypothetical protein